MLRTLRKLCLGNILHRAGMVEERAPDFGIADEANSIEAAEEIRLLHAELKKKSPSKKEVERHMRKVRKIAKKLLLIKDRNISADIYPQIADAIAWAEILYVHKFK